MFEQNVSAERQLQFEKAKHETKMVHSMSQATLKFATTHAIFRQVHNIEEVGAHRAAYQ